MRLLLDLTTIFGFNKCTSDVRKAYLQSSKTLSREFFIAKPVPEFELEPHQCQQLLRPLYGLCKSGDLWHETLDQNHRNVLGMSPFRLDSTLYHLISNGLLKCLNGGYVEEIIRVEDDDFSKLSRKTNPQFDKADGGQIPCSSTGFLLSRDKNGDILIDQSSYFRKLVELPLDA